MFILYILGICLAFNTSHFSQTTRFEQVSCARYESDNRQLLPVNLINSDEKEEQNLRLEIIKQKILQKLGLENVPVVDERVSNNIANDQFFGDILDDFDEQDDTILQSEVEKTSNLDQSKNELNQISSLTNDESIDQIYLFPVKPKYENKFLFNLTSKNNRLGNIERPKNFLLTLKKKSLEQLDDRCMIRVHKQVKNVEQTDLSSNNTIDIGLLKTADYKFSTSSLIKYNLNSLIPEILKTRPVINLSKQEEQFILFDAVNCEFESAMLTIAYENNENQRSRRSVDCAPNGQTSGCCREPFFVNFTTVGWNTWILQPSGYNAYYCKGKCDLSHSRYMYTTVSYTFPSIITQCCSPREMSSISMIYVDKENYVYKKNLPEMVVDKCDCA